MSLLFACPPTFGCGLSLAALSIFRLSGFKFFSVSLSFYSGRHFAQSIPNYIYMQ